MSGARHVHARHDGFTAKKRRKFLAALVKTGCISDAAKVAGISTTTIDRWRAKDARFARLCASALEKASANIELLAYDRAVHGAEEQVIRDGKTVQIRKKPSDAMLRMILQGSNPRKYGRQGAVLRKQIEAEVRAKIEEEMKGQGWYNEKNIDKEALRERLLMKLERLRKRLEKEKGVVTMPSGAGLSPADAAWLVAEVNAGRLTIPDPPPEKGPVYGSEAR